jgi:hypothetical protein
MTGTTKSEAQAADKAKDTSAVPSPKNAGTDPDHTTPQTGSTPDPTEIGVANEEKEREAALKKAPAQTRKKKSALADLNTSHLEAEDGSPNPISVRTEHLQATIVSDLGRPLLKMSLVGWVGEESIVVPVEQAGELREIADLLDAEAGRR